MNPLPSSFYVALLAVLAVLLLSACGSGGSGKKPRTPPTPPPIAEAFTPMTVSDVTGSTTSAAYRPTLVQMGDQGGWVVRFERDHTLNFRITDATPLPRTSWQWVMSRWSVSPAATPGDYEVDCIVSAPAGSGAPDIRSHWILSPPIGAG